MTKHNAYYSRSILDYVEYASHPMYTDRLLGRMKFPNKWMVSIVKHTVFNVFDITILHRNVVTYDVPINGNKYLDTFENLSKNTVEYILSEIEKL